MRIQKVCMTLLLAGAMMMTGGCSNQTASTTTESTTKSEVQQGDNKEETTLLVAAAASLEYSMEEKLIPLFEEENTGVKVMGTYDSSGKLQTQIEEGLNADVFFSAATTQMDALSEEGYINENHTVSLLENKLVLIVPTDSASDRKSFKDITKGTTIALGDPESVPVGQYAKEALTSLSLWDEIQDRVSFGMNVTEVLNWVAEGSADVGIVYATDAATTNQVKVIAYAPENSLETPVIYPVSTLKNSQHADTAKKFVEFLQSKEASEILKEYGFTPLEDK